MWMITLTTTRIAIVVLPTNTFNYHVRITQVADMAVSINTFVFYLSSTRIVDVITMTSAR